LLQAAIGTSGWPALNPARPGHHGCRRAHKTRLHANVCPLFCMLFHSIQKSWHRHVCLIRPMLGRIGTTRTILGLLPDHSQPAKMTSRRGGGHYRLAWDGALNQKSAVTCLHKMRVIELPMLLLFIYIYIYWVIELPMPWVYTG
jgi:hypothetical protein